MHKLLCIHIIHTTMPVLPLIPVAPCSPASPCIRIMKRIQYYRIATLDILGLRLVTSLPISSRRHAPVIHVNGNDPPEFTQALLQDPPTPTPGGGGGGGAMLPTRVKHVQLWDKALPATFNIQIAASIHATQQAVTLFLFTYL